MEARRIAARRLTGLLAALSVVLAAASTARAAGYRTTNFVIDAATPQLAKEIGDLAEHYRKSLAVEWLGRELPPWSKPCPVKAMVGPHLGAGGATSFIFDRGEVFGWKMDIQGSRERILDSVLPHEITHTIFASHFRQPLPRWADEGACTTVEHRSEIGKQERMLIDFLKTRRGIAFSEMFAMKEYPPDVLPLYSQGHSLAVYLIDQRGKRAFLSFLADGMQDENWPRAIREHYHYESLLALQESWLGWIRAGRPRLQPAGDTLLASNQPPAAPEAPAGSGTAVAAMGGMAQQQPKTAPTTGSSVPRPGAQTLQPSGNRHNSASHSVYGEKPTWRPRGVQAAPASASGVPPAPGGVAAYDTARPAGTTLR
jgi:hypothetical protein